MLLFPSKSLELQNKIVTVCPLHSAVAVANPLEPCCIGVKGDSILYISRPCEEKVMVGTAAACGEGDCLGRVLRVVLWPRVTTV